MQCFATKNAVFCLNAHTIPKLIWCKTSSDTNDFLFAHPRTKLIKILKMWTTKRPIIETINTSHRSVLQSGQPNPEKVHTHWPTRRTNKRQKKYTNKKNINIWEIFWLAINSLGIQEMFSIWSFLARIAFEREMTNEIKRNGLNYYKPAPHSTHFKSDMWNKTESKVSSFFELIISDWGNRMPRETWETQRDDWEQGPKRCMRRFDVECKYKKKKNMHIKIIASEFMMLMLVYFSVEKRNKNKMTNNSQPVSS